MLVDTTAVEATPADATVLGSLLAAAFRDNPLAVHYEPDPVRRRAILPRQFTTLIRRWLRTEPGLTRVWTTPGRDAVSVWTHADHHAPDVAEEDDLVALLGARAAERFLSAVAVADAHEPSERHHTFQLLATNPAHRRRGLARAVTVPGLGWCDSAGVPVYGWTDDAATLRMQEANGFRVIWTDRVPDGPVLHGIWRPPTPAWSPTGHPGDAHRAR